MIDTKFINQGKNFNQNSPGLNKDESIKTKNFEDYNNPTCSKQNISEERSLAHDYEPSQKTTMSSVSK